MTILLSLFCCTHCSIDTGTINSPLVHMNKSQAFTQLNIVKMNSVEKYNEIIYFKEMETL